MRELGPTFAVENIGWFDFETACDLDLKSVGLYRYMAAAEPLVLAVALGEGPVRTFPFPVCWSEMPDDIVQHMKRVLAGKAKWAAWNAAFDRECWNQITDFPELDIEHVIDVMAQATAAGLPGRLDFASRFCGGTPKRDGKKLIELFSEERAQPEDYPDEWQQFLDYAADDVNAMRDVFLLTMQLPLEDWREYWANERVNLNGIAFDQKLARRAAKMAALDRMLTGRELSRLTGGAVTKVTQVARLKDWLISVLHPLDRAFMIESLEETENEETGEIEETENHTLNRAVIRKLTALLDAKDALTPNEQRARTALDIRLYGGSSTPAKFGNMLESNVDGLLLGQFVFNGAPQTGRFSSRGVQLHNLMRDALPYEIDAIDALLDGATPDQFRAVGEEMAISRKLSMLIRPTLVPEKDDHAFVWGDWSQIEARVLPWLAGADERLNIFREVDDDPSKPDLYVRSAAAMSGIAISDVTSELRQRGKVAELACQFGGGAGALQNMAANYGMHLDREQAAKTASEWRAVNGWAVEYWADLWAAFEQAFHTPGITFPAGKVSYTFNASYLGGSMICLLPSGRALTYRRVKHEWVTTKNKHGQVTDVRQEWSFARGYGRVKLWHGILAENITQATAADVLRDTLTRCIDTPLLRNVRAHTHDEVLLEVPVHNAENIAVLLRREMERERQWSSRLPLKADTTCAYSYTKCKAATGL